MGTDDRNKIISFLDSLTDAIGNSEGQTIEEVIRELKEEGFDHDASMKRLYAVVQQASQEAKRKQLTTAREKRLAMEAKRSTYASKFAGWAKDKLIERINELMSTAGPSIAVSYRDLSSKSEADLIAILEDLQVAKEMEGIKQSDEE